jgi:hypothetical protein
MTVVPLAVVPVESRGRDRRASRRRGRPSKRQPNEPCASSSTKNQNISFGLTVLWIVCAILFTGLYFLTQIDVPNHSPTTSINHEEDTTNTAKASPPIRPPANGEMNIENVSELVFTMADGTCLKAKVNGKRLFYGGGGPGTVYTENLVVDGVPLDDTTLTPVPCRSRARSNYVY